MFLFASNANRIFLITQSQINSFCHQVTGLREGSAMSAPTKYVFSYYNFPQTCLFESHANHSFNDAMKQTSRSRTLICVLENVAKPSWYILPPDGMNA